MMKIVISKPHLAFKLINSCCLLLFFSICIFLLVSCKDSKVVDTKVYDVTFLDIFVDPIKYHDKNISIICNLRDPDTSIIFCNDPFGSRGQLFIENKTMKSKEQLRWVFEFCNNRSGIPDPACNQLKVKGILNYDRAFSLKQAELIP